MSKIFWDTNLFIYLFEKNEKYLDQTVALRRRMMERGDQLLTSAMTLGEIQVKPRKAGYAEEAERYKNTLSQVASIISFDPKAAEFYSIIRSETPVRGPDAIQLACAAAVGVEVFVTNDLRLQQIRVPNIHFITSIDRVPI